MGVKPCAKSDALRLYRGAACVWGCAKFCLVQEQNRDHFHIIKSKEKEDVRQ